MKDPIGTQSAHGKPIVIFEEGSITGKVNRIIFIVH